MPKKPLKPCRYPGCPELTESSYCTEHSRQMNQDYDRYHRNPAHRVRYHSKSWHQIRASQLARHPLCEVCLEHGKYVKATLVHHRFPIEDGGSNAEDNLCSLCQSCHSKHHQSERNRKANK